MSILFRSTPRFIPVPKHRRSKYACRRRRFLDFLDKYHGVFTQRRELFERRQQQCQLMFPEYSTPKFRFAGFWPGSFDRIRVDVEEEAAEEE